MTPTNGNGEHDRTINILSDPLCRLCTPGKFPVKSLAHQAMSSRFERLKAAGENVSPTDMLEMRRLLGIVDEILIAESYPDADQLPPFEEQPPVDLTCAACGGEIFRTALRCEGTCLRDEKTETSARNQVIICPLCFVDGRSCSCRDMQPVRVREMGPLTEARNTVHEFIHDSAGKLLLSEEEDQEDPLDAHSILTAALILYQRSQKPVGWRRSFLVTN